MTVANGLLLALGGLLLTIPIVLHFLMQPKPKTVAFPAVRFLQQLQAANQRNLRLRHILLLLLRCLAIALLALALAGPAVSEDQYGNWLGALGITALTVIALGLLIAAWWQTPRSQLLIVLLAVVTLACLVWLATSVYKLSTQGEVASLGNSSDPVSAVIVLDVSPRMGYRRENNSHLQWAQQMSEWVVNQLPLDSQIAVMSTAESDPFFSIDAAAARRKLSTAEISFQSGTIPDALRRSLQLLHDSATHGRREIYVITDLTQQSWAGASPSVLREQLLKSPDTNLFLIDVGTVQPQNFSLSLPQFSSTRLTQVSPIHVDIHLQRIGGAAERNVRLLIEQPDDTRPVIRDGQVLVPDRFWQQSQHVAVSENGSVRIHFVHNDPLPTGILHGRVEILGQDALEIDDIRYFTLEVKPAWPVLIVHPPDVSPLFLSAILAGEGDRQLGVSAYQVTEIQQSEINRFDLSQFQAVFMLNPDPISEPLWTKLKQYVNSGGNLALFLGHHALDRGESHADFRSELAREMMGGALTFPWRRPDGDLIISIESLAHPILAPFREEPDDVPWYRFPIYYHWGIELEAQAKHPTQVILRYSNRQPALMERIIGQGRVITMTTPISEPERPPGREKWNDLFSGMPVPAFLLINQMAQYLVQFESDTLNIEPGQLAVLRNDLRFQPETYALFSPRLAQIPTSITANEGQLRYRFTDAPGHYRLKGNREGPVLRGFSVNLPMAATDLTRMKSTDLDEWLGAGQYQLARDQIEIQRQQGTSRRGQEFYPLLIIMLAVLVGMEYLMANRFYARA
ncbi:MAG TPA: BatA domain-containing protein [Pirellulaceae bacterium]|nr:BatA domain-containing protein [Pirellulaceae bacterium]